MTSVEHHYAHHLAPVYEWMVGDIEAALLRSAAELDAANICGKADGVAVDLGAGIGLHAIPLAQRGYAVLAIDSSQQLLASLQTRAGSLPVTAVVADLLDFPEHLQRPADAMVCMGDTLTHLAGTAEVSRLFAAVARTLARDGVFMATFRDYVTAPLMAERRFIPVRSDAQRILTCFLEYGDDSVMVHDLLHVWDGGHWSQQVSSYQKLRLAPTWVAAQLQSLGFTARVTSGVGGMVCVVATRR